LLEGLIGGDGRGRYRRGELVEGQRLILRTF